MNNSASINLRLAKQIEQRRKLFKYKLIAVLGVGGFVGFYSSPWFAGLLETDPDHPGFRLGAWAAYRETIIAALSVHGVLIWPAVFAIIFYLVHRRGNAKLQVLVAAAENTARTQRAEETELRIAEARQSGII